MLQKPLGDDDMRVIASALRAANGISVWPNGGIHTFSGSLSSGFGALDAFAEHFGSALRDEFEGFGGHVGAFLDDLERATARRYGAEMDAASGPHALPTQPEVLPLQPPLSHTIIS